MIANILIAIGFFFFGAAFGAHLCTKELRKARKEMKNKQVIVYEF